jgi:ribonuclease HII
MLFEKMTLDEIAAHLEGMKRLSGAAERQLESDRRRGARLLLEKYRQRRLREGAEDARLHKMLAAEQVYWEQGIDHVAGVDEAGRGPLAGPVVAAAVVLPPGTLITGLNDSKQLTERTRERLFEIIRQKALGVGVGIVPVAVIDRLNIYGALMQAMRQALNALPKQPGMVLVDGYPIRGLSIGQKAIIGGDALSLSIAAASVIAKVTRDRIMVNLHAQYPEYGFARHKGYATAEHRRALSKYGPCPEHRRSFRLDY